jgi:16S rRNA (uracil1498-N3)-methyltransferase
LDEVTGADGLGEVSGGDAGEGGEGDFGTDAGDGDEFFEQEFFFWGEEAVEEHGVLTDVHVDAEFGFGAGFREAGEGGDRDVNFVAHAGGFHDDEVGVFFEYRATEMGNHRKLTFYMARRLFYVPEVRREEAELTGEAAQHLVRVLRVEEGQVFEISDNRHLYLATVTTARKSSVVFRVMERLADAAAVPEVYLLASLFKFDHFEWMLEKATELNVARIVPVVAERSEKGLEQAAGKRRERWERILLEASQQSRRMTRPELGEVVRFREALGVEARHRIFLDEMRQGPGLMGLKATADESVALLLGPEGGWAERERELAMGAGWEARSLGVNILRAETAAIAALAVMGQLMEKETV